MQGHVSALIGLPDLGSVCADHVASFLQKVDDLRATGVQKILCVAVEKPSVVDQCLMERGADKVIQGVADDTGAFTRMLGVNINNPERPQLRSQRCDHRISKLKLQVYGDTLVIKRKFLPVVQVCSDCG